MHLSIFPPGSAWGAMVFPLLLLIIFYLVTFFSWRRRKEQRLILKTVLKK
jgi:fumarate reductase subunit D